MSKTWKIIIVAVSLLAVILLYLNLRRGSKEMESALEHLESSKASLDNATKKVEESSAVVDSMERDVKAYAGQVRRSDSLVGELEKRRMKTEQNFYSRINTTQGKYYSLKEELDNIRRRYWPEITIDTSRQTN